jgi:hypothetical protein
MAIVGTVELENGLKIEAAYLKVIKADLRYVEQYREWYMTYTVAVYANKVSRRQKKEPVAYENYMMKVDLSRGDNKKNIIETCYADYHGHNLENNFQDV